MPDHSDLSTGRLDSASTTTTNQDTMGTGGTQMVAVDVAAATHPGRHRPNNEDHYLVSRLGRAFEVITTNLPEGRVPARYEETGYAMAVADGMGGAVAGEVASGLAISLGARFTVSASTWTLRLDGDDARALVHRAERYFHDIHRAVSERARTTPGLEGMGTTLTVAYAVGWDLFVFHVGDSRAYLLRDGQLTQLTRDQTVAQALADAGKIRPEDVARHDLRHVLTQAIGTEGGANDIEVRQARLRAGDRLLLCTDGLSDMASDETIAGVLAESDTAERACEALIATALEAGGRDNVTVIAALYAARS